MYMEKNDNGEQVTIDALAQFVYKNMVTKEDLELLTRKEDLKFLATKFDLEEVRAELKNDIRDVRTIVLETDTKVDELDKGMRDVTERVTLLEDAVFPASQE